MTTISLADADRQTEAVKKIMSDRGLNFGPAYDVYIEREAKAALVKKIMRGLPDYEPSGPLPAAFGVPIGL